MITIIFYNQMNNVQKGLGPAEQRLIDLTSSNFT